MKKEAFKYYVGFDPSFTCYGVSVIDTENKKVYLNSFKLSPGSKKLKLITWAALNLIESIARYLGDKNFLNRYTFISQESPAPRAPGSSLTMLWVLGTNVYREFGSLSKYEAIDLYNVMAMRTLHNGKKHEKKDTMDLVVKILDIIKENGYSIIYDKKYDDGMADSFIYALLGYIKNTGEKDTLVNKILEEYPQLRKIKSEVD